MITATPVRILSALVVSAALAAPAAAQKIVGTTGPVPAPVALDITGLFQEKYASVGDDLFVGGQPTEKALRDLKAKGVNYVVGRAYYADSARGEIIGDRTGFLKLIFKQADMKLLGVHVMGEQATELVHIGLMGMLTGSSAEVFSQACFNFPTLGDLYQDAADDALRRRAETDQAG